MNQLSIIFESLVRVAQVSASRKDFERVGKDAANKDIEPPIDLDPVNAWIYLEKMESLIKGYKSALEENVLEAVERAGGTIERSGATIEAAEVGIKWDHSKDPIYNRLKSEAAEYTQALKAREKETRGLKASRTELDKETGELIEVPPPVRTSTSKFKVSLKAAKNE